MQPVLDVEELKVDIDTGVGLLHPVRGVSFSVSRGETLAIVGESGCGKSLTALALIQLLPSGARMSAAKLNFVGQSLIGLGRRELSALRGDRIGMVFQDPMTALNPSFTIGNQLIETLRQHRSVTKEQARLHVLEMLQKVGIAAPESRLGQYPHQLSGGLRQRVVIAMALMCDPDLLIADEPTTALDVTIQAQILRLLAGIQRETGMGLICITHDLGVVASIAEKVVVMYGGQIVEAGRTADVLQRPMHPYTEGLLMSLPIPNEARDGGGMLGSIPGFVLPPVGDLSCCGFVERCPYAFDSCLRAPIDLAPIGDDRSFRCLLPADTSERDKARWLQSGEILS